MRSGAHLGIEQCVEKEIDKVHIVVLGENCIQRFTVPLFCFISLTTPCILAPPQIPLSLPHG